MAELRAVFRGGRERGGEVGRRGVGVKRESGCVKAGGKGKRLYEGQGGAVLEASVYGV